jgi:hypothetical protein
VARSGACALRVIRELAVSAKAAGTHRKTGVTQILRRRQERREGGDATRYQMRQRVISIGDDYVIENDHGERAFRVDGKALRVRQTLLFEDMQGRELCKIQERMLRVKDSMEIEDPDGRRMAMVKKAMITP